MSDADAQDLEVELTKEVDAAATRKESGHEDAVNDDAVDEDQGSLHTITKKAVHNEADAGGSIHHTFKKKFALDDAADEDDGSLHTIKKKSVHHVKADEDEGVFHTLKKKTSHHAMAGEDFLHKMSKKFAHHVKAGENEEDASQKALAHEAFKRSQAAQAKQSKNKINGDAKTANYLTKMKAMEDKWNAKKNKKIDITAQMAAGTYVKPVKEKKEPAAGGLGDIFKKWR